MTDGRGLRPAGWYDDPASRGKQRYWDGTAWTSDVRSRGMVPPPGSAAAAWDLGWLLFSYEGRAHTAHFWGSVGIQIAAFLVMIIVVVSANDAVGGVVALAWLFAAIWAGLAVSVKRWHDRDKSGWWVLIWFVPLIGTVWAFVETGFFAGTSGINRFGADPRGEPGEDRSTTPTA